MNGAAIITLPGVGGAQGQQPGLYLAWKGWGGPGRQSTAAGPGAQWAELMRAGRRRPHLPPFSSAGSPWLEGSLRLDVPSFRQLLCLLRSSHPSNRFLGRGLLGTGVSRGGRELTPSPARAAQLTAAARACVGMGGGDCLSLELGRQCEPDPGWGARAGEERLGGLGWLLPPTLR